MYFDDASWRIIKKYDPRAWQAFQNVKVFTASTAYKHRGKFYGPIYVAQSTWKAYILMQLMHVRWKVKRANPKCVFYTLCESLI